MAKFKILFEGEKSSPYNQILAKAGTVTITKKAPADGPPKGYDLFVVDGKIRKSLDSVIASASKGKFILGVVNASKSQIAKAGAQTGANCPFPTNGFMYSLQPGSASPMGQMMYLPQYSAEFKKQLRKKGWDPDQMMAETVCNAINIQKMARPAKTASKKAPRILAGPPPSNNLIPTYTQSPFKMLEIVKTPVKVSLSNMKNLSQITANFSTQLYCYREDQNQKDDFIVIAVTQLSEISNGNPLYFSQSDHDSCYQCTFLYDWSLWFNYAVRMSCLGSDNKPITTKMEIYTSSPPKADKGQKTITDSIGIPLPFTIYMYVLDNGTWRNVSFPASYSRTLDDPNLKWFAVNNQDNAGAGVTGIQWAMSKGNGSGTASQVGFEMVTCYRFQKEHIVNSKFLVTFNFDIDLKCSQEYCQCSSCSGSICWPQCSTTNGGSTVNVKSPQYDLVKVTSIT